MSFGDILTGLSATGANSKALSSGNGSGGRLDGNRRLQNASQPETGEGRPPGRRPAPFAAVVSRPGRRWHDENALGVAAGVPSPHGGACFSLIGQTRKRIQIGFSDWPPNRTKHRPALLNSWPQVRRTAQKGGAVDAG